MASYRETSVDDPSAHALIAEYFELRRRTFPPELGAYAPKFPPASDFVPPSGVFLVVVDETDADSTEDVGCGGVREIAPGRFEIKHVYLKPSVQGRGLGRALLAELENRAIGFGATEIVLDTNASLVAAGQLYRSSGYVNIEPYNDNPNATDWFLKRL